METETPLEALARRIQVVRDGLALGWIATSRMGQEIIWLAIREYDEAESNIPAQQP